VRRKDTGRGLASSFWDATKECVTKGFHETQMSPPGWDKRTTRCTVQRVGVHQERGRRGGVSGVQRRAPLTSSFLATERADTEGLSCPRKGTANGAVKTQKRRERDFASYERKGEAERTAPGKMHCVHSSRTPQEHLAERLYKRRMTPQDGTKGRIGVPKDEQAFHKSAVARDASRPDRKREDA
jgi:hypothetical protein